MKPEPTVEDLDLTKEKPSESVSGIPSRLRADPGSPVKLRRLKTEAYDPSRDRETVRGRIAGGLVVILAFIVVVTFIGLFSRFVETKDLKDILSIILGPIVALVGSATGFYFGAKSEGSTPTSGQEAPAVQEGRAEDTKKEPEATNGEDQEEEEKKDPETTVPGDQARKRESEVADDKDQKKQEPGVANSDDQKKTTEPEVEDAGDLSKKTGE